MLLAAGLLLACRLTESGLSPVPLTPADSQPASPPAAPSATLPPPSPTAVPQPCAVSSGSPALPAAQGSALADYLNQGGSTQGLGEQFQGGTSLVDFDGDGWIDLALAANVDGTGRLFAFRCAADHYELAYVSAELPSPGLASIQTSQDLSGDGVADLLVSRQECGAHTCSAQVEALVWIDGRLANRLDGDSSDLPTPVIEWMPAAAGAAEIRITATGIASVGAGPFRMLERSWDWDPGQRLFVPQSERLLESNFRIHRLHDADDSANSGDLDGALALYRQVIDDPELDDWLAGDDGYQQLAAYARFRVMLAILQIGDLGSVEEALGELQLAHPAGTPGAGFAELGAAFWSAFASSNQGARPPSSTAIAAGCRAAQAYSLTHSEETIDLLYYGYANRAYDAESLCPLSS